MYNDIVMEHFMNPQNVGVIEDADGVGQVGNVKCGDIMKIYLKIDENEVIEDIKFKTFGCGSAVASSSMATVIIKGKTVTLGIEVLEAGFESSGANIISESWEVHPGINSNSWSVKIPNVKYWFRTKNS